MATAAPAREAEDDRRAPSSEALRRAALARSAARGAQVARRRLLRRWAAWLLLRMLGWIVLPALLVAAALWVWRSSETSGEPPDRAASAAEAERPAVRLQLDPAVAARPGVLSR